MSENESFLLGVMFLSVPIRAGIDRLTSMFAAKLYEAEINTNCTEDKSQMSEGVSGFLFGVEKVLVNCFCLV